LKYESRNFVTAFHFLSRLTWTMYKNLPIFLKFFLIMAIEIFSHLSFSFSLFGYIQQVKLRLRSCGVRVPLWNPNLVRGVCTAKPATPRSDGGVGVPGSSGAPASSLKLMRDRDDDSAARAVRLPHGSLNLLSDPWHFAPDRFLPVSFKPCVSSFFGRS
jgi:hypothetical protein